MAPAGGDSLMVLVPTGHLADWASQSTPGAEPQDWPALVARARATVLARLAAEGLDDLRERIKFEVCYTPETWAEAFNLARGSAFGLSLNFAQVGYLRPANRHATYRNLYFVGSSTHPGTGLPIVLISARLAVERILKEQAAPAANGSTRVRPAWSAELPPA
jgi:phytoene dehydrogenase-like protein